MRALLGALLFAAACGETLTVTIAPTTPNVRESSAALKVASKRVRVVDSVRVDGGRNVVDVRVGLRSRDAVTATRAAAAVTVAEAELLAAGWQPLDDDDWNDDDRDARLVLRAISAGVDRAHPLDGCRSGPHVYGYWVAVTAALVDADGKVAWTADATARSTDLVRQPARVTADAWFYDRCERLLDAAALARALADSGCDDFTANRCDPLAPLSPLVAVAVRQLVQTLVKRANAGVLTGTRPVYRW